MISQIIYKVPEGKVIRIEMEFSEVIKSIKISGDFFLHPEEAIERIEEALAGTALEEKSIFDAIMEVAELEKIKFFGIDAASLTRAILLCGGKQ